MSYLTYSHYKIPDSIPHQAIFPLLSFYAIQVSQVFFPHFLLKLEIFLKREIRRKKKTLYLYDLKLGFFCSSSQKIPWPTDWVHYHTVLLVRTWEWGKIQPTCGEHCGQKLWIFAVKKKKRVSFVRGVDPACGLHMKRSKEM